MIQETKVKFILLFFLFLKTYEEIYKEEIDLNQKLNFFAENYQDVYGNSNTLRAQIGFSSDRGKFNTR